ncbi:MAG: hypothetical protein ACOYOL_05655 [Chthoniobacterales bacterium]
MNSMAMFPGAELVQQGVADLRDGAVTVEACLASMASPRLVRHGLLEETVCLVPEAELTLYRLLGQEAGDAYARYNSLVRRLVSFERALDHAGIC